MPGGVLADVQAHQEQAEGHRPTQAIEQGAIGNDTHAALMQRLVAQLQPGKQVMVVMQYIGTCRLRFAQRRVCPITGCAQALTQLLEHSPIGFGAVPGHFTQRRAGLLHRQLGGQAVDIAQEQVGGHPARQQQHFTGDGRSDIGIAITVAAHPGRKANGRGFQRQVQAGGFMQGLVGLAQVIGYRLPQRVLDDGEAPLGFVHRGRPGAADFFGVPGFGDQALQALLDLLALGRDQVAVILSCQLRGNSVVFLDQGATGDFSRVRGEHQFDVQTPQLPGQCVIAVARDLEPGE
ncbi:hypothetical protein D3C85_939320 [compost metagenome]